MSRISSVRLAGLAASFTAAPLAGVQAQGVGDNGAYSPMPMDEATTLSLTGGALWSNFYKANPLSGFEVEGESLDKLGSDKLGLLGNEVGGYGSIALNGYLSGPYDWHVALSGTVFPTNEKTIVEDDGFSTEIIMERSEFHYYTMDFDVGRTNKLADYGYTRFGLGLRTLYAGLEHSTHLSFSDKGGFASTDKMGNASYWGAGPFVTASAYVPLSNSRFSLVGVADASLLFGRLRQTGRLEINDDGFTLGESFSQTDGEIAYTVGGSIGLGYAFTDNFKTVLGYRGEVLGIGDIDPIFSHGIFLTGKIKLGGP